MYTRNLVILANSIKFTGHCIAGKDLDTGGWVRLINNHPGPFSNTDLNRLYGDPEGPSLLSCIKISFQERVPLYYQPENEVITGDPWVKIGDYLQKKIGLLEDTQVPCWLGDGAYGFQDRIPAAICNSTTPLPRSLHFTKLKQSENNLTISYKQHETGYKPRLNFHFKGIYYNLGLTDIDYPRLANGDDTKPKPIQDSFVTLGVGQLFEPKNAFFKLVVGIIHSDNGVQDNPDEHPVVQPTNTNDNISLEKPSVTHSILESDARTKTAPHLNVFTVSYEQKLFVELKNLCQSIAQQSHVEPFMVFPYKSLREMAHFRPCDLDSFRNINGVGGRKLERYGLIFTSAIKNFCEKNGIEITHPDIIQDSEHGDALEQIYNINLEISNLNDKLKELILHKNDLLDQVKTKGIRQQGNYILQSSTTSIRQLNLEAFKQLYPQILMEIGFVRLSDADAILGKAEVTELCTFKESTRYSVKEIKSDSGIQENPP
jgi:hypothetical protein